MERKLLPLYIDLGSRTVVIFGGGRVAERKAQLFSMYSRVKVISRAFSRALEEMGAGGEVELIREDLSLGTGFDEHLKGAFIAIPATSDSEINSSIGDRAKELGLLVNRVEGIGDIVVPSIVSRGPVTVAISSLGESPALSKYLRLRLERELSGDYSDMARLLGQIREELKRDIPDQRSRADIIWSILSDQEVWSLLGESYEKAYMRAREHATQDERDSLNAGHPSQGLNR